MNRNLLVNEVVFLAADHDWNAGHSNPLTCFGKVTRIHGDNVAVTWANGSHNSYNGEANDLVPVVYNTREEARTAAMRNRNVFVYRRIDGFYTLMIRRSLVINDNRREL